MFETIVVPLDGSEHAEEALGRAVEVAKKFESRLILVQAVESMAQRLSQPPGVLESPTATAASVDVLQTAIDAEKEAARKYLGDWRDRLTSEGLKVEAFVGEGAAADVILGLGKDQGADLIVMSTHGRGGLGRLFFGSVADAVLRHSEVPVLLVRTVTKD